ncbi:hypothetical protein F383_28717 [Gossypium arboreum]|uniref:Uncharacterized protein n=1 Tax=Gossypium arboreum TaxID=29729 RepID=A0A0B0PFK9_GOSAR|nr:hypothetical protein F383_28717 [Gossypium arboreum]
MSGDTSDSSSYFDGREPDELIRALVEKSPGKITHGLHYIDLESNKVFIRAMPPDAPSCSTAVACGNHVYVIGGIRENDANFRGYDGVNDVFQLDLKDLERGWRKTISMLFPRAFPLVLAAEGKIYVFEYWDSCRSRILVHCHASDALYAYYYDLAPPPGSTLYRLGNGKLILGWVNHFDKRFEYIRFNIRCNEQGGIHAAAEHQSPITVPYPEDMENIWLF